ncbi:MAG: biotin--[acetyl-CoA-carboxylase] ligase [Georgenia sp.]
MTPTPSPFSRVVRVSRATSTNAELAAAARADPAAWPHLSVLVAERQDAGRGRAGRTWVTAPGTALTCSILLRPAVPPETMAWVTLLAGLAVVRAGEDLLGAAGVRLGVKWPNDVLALDVGDSGVEGWGRDRKVAGILAETVPAAPGDVVLGVGVNVAQRADQLPVPWAASLHLVAAPRPTAEDVLGGVGTHLAGLLRRWEDARGDAETAGLADEVRAVCTSLGRAVRVDLPGGETLAGTAIGIDPGGRLLVEAGGLVRPVAAGDVRHVRAAGPDPAG